MKDYKECTDCVHYEFCLSQEKYLIEHNRKDLIRRYGFGLHEVEHCKFFKDRSRFVELPCKVGDVVYCLAKPSKRRITKISITTYGLRLSVNDMFCFDESQIGKTVFFTKEQSEQALKERE